VVEHQVDDDTRNADVHPDRPDPAGELTMAVELTPVGPQNDGYDEWEVERSKDYVRNEDGKIDRPCPVVMRVGDRTNIKVVDEIRCQEENRRSKSTDHHSPV
jgi:hypothetical protein